MDVDCRLLRVAETMSVRYTMTTKQRTEIYTQSLKDFGRHSGENPQPVTDTSKERNYNFSQGLQQQEHNIYGI